jgi:hypothetical protein
MSRKAGSLRTGHKRLRMTVAEANRSLCSSEKRAYMNVQSAKTGARDIWFKIKSINVPYQCPECHKYHLTTSNISEKQAGTLVNQWKDYYGIPRVKLPKKTRKKEW